MDFEPGDTIGILPENKADTVETILTHLELTKTCDLFVKIVNTHPQKKYLPALATVHHLFTYFINFQAIPSKQLLLLMSDHTKDPSEKQELAFLSSIQGANSYRSTILEAGVTFIKILLKYKTCKPPVEALIEHLPRLLPRPYSIASSKDAGNKIRIVLSILKNCREGLCTGMIRRAFDSMDNPYFWIFLRKSHGFRLQENSSPLVLIGPGTGIAPYIGEYQLIILRGLVVRAAKKLV